MINIPGIEIEFKGEASITPKIIKENAEADKENE